MPQRCGQVGPPGRRAARRRRWTAIERPGSTPSDELSTSGRRAFLIFGATAGLGLAGCSVGRRSGPDGQQSSPVPPPKPAPLPGTVGAAARENDLAAFAAAALDRFGTGLSTADRHLLSRLRDAHLAHVAVLQRQDPTSAGPIAAPSRTPATPTTPSATPPSVGHSPKAARAKLRRLESRACRAYADLAVTPAGPADQLGRLALLWGSLATASAGHATACESSADPGPAVFGDHRANVALPDPGTAVQAVVAQCYPMIFGYQTALAALSGTSADRARSSLSGYRELHDQLAGRLAEQKLPVPAPQAAYRLPVQPTTAARAAKLISLMETRMLPYLGQWLATSGTPHERQHALQTMINIATDRLTWSARIIVWPGYPLS